MSGPSVIRATGQRWKLTLGASVMLAGFVTAWYGLLSPRSADSLELTLMGVLAGVLSVIATCGSIRCPACGARWAWSALQEQDCRYWLVWLLEQSDCPRCGHHPGDREGPAESRAESRRD